jgi:hypothetical protein
MTVRPYCRGCAPSCSDANRQTSRRWISPSRHAAAKSSTTVLMCSARAHRPYCLSADLDRHIHDTSSKNEQHQCFQNHGRFTFFAVRPTGECMRPLLRRREATCPRRHVPVAVGCFSRAIASAMPRPAGSPMMRCGHRSLQRGGTSGAGQSRRAWSDRL